VQFVPDALTDEVYAEVSANRHLAARFRLDRPSRDLLEALGWQRPSQDDRHPNWWLISDRVHADQLAALAVEALRDVFGVVHPAFLRGVDGPAGPPARPADPGPQAGPARSGPSGADHPVTVTPKDGEHLQRLVDEALTPVLGHVPRRDEDGDIPIIVGESVVFVRALPDVPVIRLFVDLALDVSQPDRAGFEVRVLNRDHPFARFSLEDGEIRAVLHLPAFPFAPEHLRQAVHLMCGMAERVAEDLAVRVGGRQFLSQPTALPAERAATPSLAARIRSLDAEHPGGVHARQVAFLCGQDVEVVLGLLHWAREHEVAAHEVQDRAIAAGDGTEDLTLLQAAVDDARRIRKVVREALRLVVEDG
jgi:hypothetical protein